MSNPDLMTTREVAKALKLTPRQVARLVAHETLRPFTQAPGVRGAYLFERAAVESLKAERRAS